MSAPNSGLDRTALVIARTELSPSVFLLRLRQLEGSLVWQPGQYVQVASPKAPEVSDFYSIASAPELEAPGEFELVMSRSANVEIVEQLAPGRTLLVSAPQGAFVWQPGPGATLLIGIGTGVAPLRAMLQAALTDSNERVALLLGTRTETDVLFRTEFESLARRDPRFLFEPTLSRPGPDWPGARGRVQDHLPRWVETLRGPRVFVCGKRSMVDGSIAILVALGLPRERIFGESHGE
jgi:NAD(P)H-flavin reductase